MNHATSPKLYRSYYPHWLRDSLSPVCGIVFITRPLQNCIGPTIRIGQENWCLPCAGFCLDSVLIKENKNKKNGWTPLITDPPSSSFTTLLKLQ